MPVHGIAIINALATGALASIGTDMQEFQQLSWEEHTTDIQEPMHASHG